MRVCRVAMFGLALMLTFLPIAAFPQSSDDIAPRFDASSYGQYLRRGDGVTVGRLAVQLQNGEVVTKGGATVLALPDSAYTRWWFVESAAEIGRRPGSSADPILPLQLRPFARYVATDAEGNFQMARLPHGRYLFRGRLSIAFPREISTDLASPLPQDAYGDRTEISRSAVVFDYSTVWLDSQAVRVGSQPSEDIVFRLVARRDIVDRHRS